MAASTKLPVGANSGLERYHLYHAEAHILNGELEHPIRQPLENYGHVKLDHTRRESLSTRSVGETNIEGLITFRAGHTRVVGTHVQQKIDILGNDHAGWVTLSTATLEGYNVVDVITAERVVAQVSTEHAPVNGHVPTVSFLGSRFEDLRIGGYKVEVDLDLDLCGAKPAGGRSYLEDSEFLDRVESQLEAARETKGAPDALKKKYKAEIEYIDDLKRRAKGRAKDERNSYPKLECSLVKRIGEIPIAGVKTFGNLIFIPNFGTVSLASVEVGVRDSRNPADSGNGGKPGRNDSHYFTLNMFEMRLGCPVKGTTTGPSGSTNGQTRP